MIVNPGYFPPQNLLESAKDDEWKIQCVLALVGAFGSSRSYLYNVDRNNSMGKKHLYDLYNGIINHEEYEYATLFSGATQSMRENKTGLQFPAKLRNYNIIKPIVDVLNGEQMKRRMDFNIVATNADAVDEKREMKIEYETAMLVQQLEKELEAEFGRAGDEIRQKYIESYQEFVKSGGKLKYEKLANDIANYLIEKTRFYDKTNGEGFLNLEIADEEIYKITVDGDDVGFRVVNPINFWCQFVDTSWRIEESDALCERRDLNMGQIMAEFSEYLDDEQVNNLERYFRNRAPLPPFNMGLGFKDWDMNNYYYGTHQPNNTVPVFYVEWVSRRAITQPSVTGKDPVTYEMYDISDEDNKPHWVNEVWEGVSIGGTMFPYIRPAKIQRRQFDNPNKVSLSYKGIVRTMYNTVNKSFVEHGYPYQELFNLIMFKAEEAISRSKGKLVMVDVSQIPQTAKLGIDPLLHQYYMDANGTMYIDPTQWSEISGQPSSFNQWAVLDRSNANEIQAMYQAAEHVRKLWQDLSGVSDQRLGTISSTETVGGVERSISQSSYITESLFQKHSIAQRDLLSALIDTAKEVWSSKTKNQFPIGSFEYVQLDGIDDKMKMCDFGVFVSGNVEQKELRAKLEQVAAEGIKGGHVDLVSFMDILESNSIQDKKRKIELALEKRAQEAQKAEQMRLEQEAKLEQHKAELKKLELQFSERQNIRDNETKITIEQMKIDAGQRSLFAETEKELLLRKVDAELDNDKSQETADQLSKKVKDDEEKESETETKTKS